MGNDILKTAVRLRAGPQVSIAEEILQESLDLVLHNVVVERNARPEFLTNPETGKRLELDFYLPQLGIGIEVQGPHHYSDPAQTHRDEIKRVLAGAAGVYLIEVSILQIDPVRLSRKIYGGLRERNLPLGCLNPFSTSWLDFSKDRVRPYRRGILATYGRSKATTSPAVVRHEHAKEVRLGEILSSSIAVFRRRGILCRGRILRKEGRRSIVVRPFGSSKEIFLRAKDIEELL